MAKNNLCWLESEAMDLSSAASKGQIFLSGRLPLQCSSLSALSTGTVESPQVSSRVFMPCFPWNGKTDLSLLKYYISSPKIKINLRKQFTRTKCSLEAGGKTRPCFMLFALRRPVMRETTSEGNRSCLRAGRQIWSECRACDVVCENQRTSVWVCVCVWEAAGKRTLKVAGWESLFKGIVRPKLTLGEDWAVV